MKLTLSDTFSKELPADCNRANIPRQVFNACFSFVQPRKPSQPTLLHVSDGLLDTIGLTVQDAQSDEFLSVFSGAKIIEGSDPYAMCYGGHQFGNWAGQLGDGRAINLAEVEHGNKRWALQLKGAGKTAYSRTADGLAVLRSSIREYLCAEAMHHLGVPTTRSLSLMLSGDEVLRDVLYDGNPAYEKGAIVCRVAPSFIRFGNFEIFASRKDIDSLKKLTDYTVRHFYPEIDLQSKDAYVTFFKTVAKRTLDTIIHWQRVGFVHGVMNTDNLSILGLTIDYGPYGWLEGYDDNWTPNTTDSQGRRYRYVNQPGVGLWNLAQLGSALLPLIGEVEPLQKILDSYEGEFKRKYLAMMRSKLGLEMQEEKDSELVGDLERILQVTEIDMTIFFRNLSSIAAPTTITDEDDLLDYVQQAFYKAEELSDDLCALWNQWLRTYIVRLGKEKSSADDRRIKMNAVNPKYVLRNYMAQLAIDKADEGDYSLIDELYQLLKKPYDEQPEMEKWFAKRPEWARHKVGCSMLSCSS